MEKSITGDSRVMAIDDYKKNIEANKDAPDSWCVLPWTHVSVKGNGAFRVCCHSNSSESRGMLQDSKGENLHVSKASWQEVVNSDRMKSVRKDMLNGKWPEACLRCEREFKSGMKSRNIYERSMIAELTSAEEYPSYTKAKALTKDDGSIDNKDFPVSFLDIRFGNLCNLKCVMCSPTDSNQWYDDYNKIWGYKSFMDSHEKIELVKNKKGKLQPSSNIYEWSDDPHIWNQIYKHIDQFRRIYIVGGEPLMIDAHYDFLQKCIDHGVAGKLMLEYNSNITNVPQRAWNIWKHFKLVLMGISIDGIGDTNNLIRFPSKWWKIEENLKKFISAEGTYQLHITSSISNLNIWHLPDFIEYFIKSNYMRLGPWEDQPLMTPHPVHRPSYLNINILPDSFKEKIKKRFAEYKERWKNENWEELYGPSKGATWKQKFNHANIILDRFENFMYKVQYEEKMLTKWRSNMVHFMDKLDDIRKTDWKATCPELYDNVKEWYNLPKGLF